MWDQERQQPGLTQETVEIKAVIFSWVERKIESPVLGMTPLNEKREERIYQLVHETHLDPRQGSHFRSKARREPELRQKCQETSKDRPGGQGLEP